MEHMKYIIIELMGFQVPIIFSPLLSHDDFCGSFGGTTTSAGFVDIDLETGKLYCFGKSLSLGKKSRPEDEEIIRREINNYKRDR